MLGLLLTLIAGGFFLLGCIIAVKKQDNKQIISFSLGIAFSVLILLLIVDIIPETLELLENKLFIIPGILIGLGTLLTLEKLVPHHDHYEEKNKHHHFNHLKHISIMTSLALIIHNIVEGISIYAAGQSSLKTGLLYTLAVGLHNIPFGLEITAMFKKVKARNEKIYITILTLSTFIGGLFMFIFNGILNDLFLGILLSITIGMIIYIIVAELFIELKENWNKNSLYGIITGIILIILGGLL